MNSEALEKIEYGMFVLSANDGNIDNACIINVVAQVTDTPKRITFTVNKHNLTHNMVDATGKFVISILSEKTNLELIKHFGFQSGRDVNKFETYTNAARANNGIYYITENTNAYIAGEISTKVDLGSHTLFVAEVIDEKVLSNEKSLTYEYYHKNIKPQTTTEVKHGWVCKICGYIYEGDDIPADFICPWCKHGVADFEKIEIK